MGKSNTNHMDLVGKRWVSGGVLKMMFSVGVISGHFMDYSITIKKHDSYDRVDYMRNDICIWFA